VTWYETDVHGDTYFCLAWGICNRGVRTHDYDTPTNSDADDSDARSDTKYRRWPAACFLWSERSEGREGVLGTTLPQP